MEFRYQVGQRVRLNTEDFVGDYSGGEGVIEATLEYLNEPCYEVKWDNGSIYAYQESNLVADYVLQESDDDQDDAEADDPFHDETPQIAQNPCAEVPRPTLRHTAEVPYADATIDAEQTEQNQCPLPQHAFHIGQRVRMTDEGIAQYGNQSLGGLGTVMRVNARAFNQGHTRYYVLWDQARANGEYDYLDTHIEVVEDTLVEPAIPREFQRGDRVRLNEEGMYEYSNQSGGGVGTFNAVSRYEGEGWYGVNWDNGNSNSYQLKHLELALEEYAHVTPSVLIGKKQTKTRQKVIKYLNNDGRMTAHRIIDRETAANSTEEQLQQIAENYLIRDGIKCDKFTIVDL